jgi:perosamine synthetase
MWNMRMSNLNAALGLAQLERIDEFNARKRHIGAQYNMLLADIDGVQLPVPAHRLRGKYLLGLWNRA